MSTYRGSPLGIRLIIGLYNIFGYKVAKVLVFTVALFYTLATQSKRKELASYYNAVGLNNSLITYFHHVYAFSLNIFDRFIAKEGMQEETVQTTRINLEAFEALQKTGGLLTLSHHGNWAQSFKIFQTYDIKLNIISDELIDENLQQLETEKEHNSRISIINLNEGMQAMLDIARALQNNEVVIIMVDRVQELNKTVEVTFLGRKTLFHSGGFEIANMRKVPMLGCDVVRTGDNGIKVEFSNIIRSDKSKKSEVIQDLAQQYALFLEKVVKEYPYQWFNFFDFWKHTDNV